MLDTEPKNLHGEILAAEEFRDKHLKRYDEMRKHYVGQGYRQGWDGDWSENHMYEYVRLTTGRIVFDNPRVNVRTRRPGSQRLVAQAIQHGLNRWVKDTNLRRMLKRVFVDQCFAYSVVMTVVENSPWMDPREESIPSWPMSYQIEPQRFGFDPFANHFGQSRFAFHKWVRDKSDIEQEAKSDKSAGWDMSAVKGLAGSTGIESLRDREDRNVNVNRNEVVGYDVWVPEVETRPSSEGFHGTIFTIAQTGPTEGGSQAAYLREPRAYYGPRWGPYTMYGVYPVPGDPYPMSPFSCMYKQMSDLNSIVKATNTAIRDYKRIVLFDAGNPELAEKLNKPDSFLIPVKGFQKDQVVELQSGGITEQHKAQIQDALERLDRNTGLSQTKRGAVNSGATATEIAVADQAGEESISYVKQEFTDSTVQVLKTAGWYLYHDDRVSFPLGEEAVQDMIDPETGEPYVEPWFEGGSHEEGSDARFDDLELEIEPRSMERVNESLMRAQYKEFMEIVLGAAPIIPMAPFYDWKKLFDMAGDVLNESKFSDFYDPNMAMQVGAGMQGGGGGIPEVNPAMSPNVPGDQASNQGLPGNQTGGKLAGLQQTALAMR